MSSAPGTAIMIVRRQPVEADESWAATLDESVSQALASLEEFCPVDRQVLINANRPMFLLVSAARPDSPVPGSSVGNRTTLPAISDLDRSIRARWHRRFRR